MDRKYIVITGGVISGLGKGIAAASIGRLLSQKYNIVPIKCDGYLNVDPGTMNPVEHGEVFVLDDGTEVDMDFGHYERFLNTTCKGNQNLTMGKVFEEIRKKERKGDFLGKTVQFVPHVSEFILNWWENVSDQNKSDITLIEIGGTIGDIENELYVEAARLLQIKHGRQNVMFAHLTYVPIPSGVDEQKSKPTQQSLSLLRQRGINPDIVMCRCKEFLTDNIKNKIASFCNLDINNIITAIDVDTVYKIPTKFNEQGVLKIIQERLNIEKFDYIDNWNDLFVKHEKKITIAICGKYTNLEDSYASVVEALWHSSLRQNVDVEIKFFDTQKFESNKKEEEFEKLKKCDGIIIPGGFGSRGVEGKIEIIKYARENNIPFLGICYGLQLAVVEFARNICNLTDANTTEINPETKNPIITILEDKKNEKNIGGTLRKGSYKAIIKENTKIFELYNSNVAYERHRHRYEVNPLFHETLEENGLSLCAMSPEGKLVEFIENKNNDYFVATQAHPELKSSFDKPAPLFWGLIDACIKRK
ncbi:MAG: CTP synthase (glutamine hydrolyzing) [Candidatus Nanoarchaeia archaeon]|nr:CTP synthase (glutamine hydrolyzing) [Candidatus Nanoarchaeia archaeon]